MKAPAFDYVRPQSLDDLFGAMASHGDDARLLAGGQTLLATLNMRLSEPAMLIDIGGIAALKGIECDGAVLRIGALVTHREIEASPVIAEHAPLLAAAAPHIAHPAIRNFGTWGGSIAFADPAAEWPTCLVALDGTVVARSACGERRIAARDFFVDLYATALEPDEIVAACEIPVRRADEVAVFDELARRHGDYAIVGMALVVARADDRLVRPRIAFLGVGSVPTRAVRTEAAIEGRSLTASSIDDAVAALAAELDPPADLTNSAATKRHLASVLLRRALTAQLPSSP